MISANFYAGMRRLDQAHPERSAVAEDIVVEDVGRMVALVAVTHADQNHRAGTRLQHEGEILGAHHRNELVVDALGADDVAGDIGGNAGLARMIHRHRIHPRVFRLGRAAIGAGDAVGDLADAALDEIAHLGVERAHGAAELGDLRNDVEGGAGVELRDRDHRRFQRIDVARDDRLQRAHDLRPDQHAVDCLVRTGAGMAALAVNGDLDVVGGSEHRAGGGREMAFGETRHVVHAVDLLDVPAGHHAVLDHRLAATAAFLGGLEDHHSGAVEIARLGEIFCRAEQHRGVAIMAAGVHLAGDLRSISYAGGFHDRQCVHVGPQADGLARGRFAAADHADDAGAADARHHLVAAEFPQAVGDDAGGAVDFVEQLRVLVEVMAPGGHFVGEGGDAIDDGHGAGSVCFEFCRHSGAMRSINPESEIVDAIPVHASRAPE